MAITRSFLWLNGDDMETRKISRNAVYRMAADTSPEFWALVEAAFFMKPGPQLDDFCVGMIAHYEGNGSSDYSRLLELQQESLKDVIQEIAARNS